MKTAITFTLLSLLFLALAYTAKAEAATITLPLPSTYALTGHSCGTPATHVVPGSESWSADGNYFTLTAEAVTVCSTGGRGSHPATYAGAESVTYNLAGLVVSSVRVTPVPPIAPYPQGTVVYFVNPVNGAYEVELYHMANLSDMVTLVTP